MHRRAQTCRQLRQVLVSQRQADAQTSRLGQHVGDVGGQVQVVLELVDVDHHRRPLVGRARRTRPRAACQSCETASEPSSAAASGPMSPLASETSSTLRSAEDGVEVERRLRLPDNGAHARTQQEGPQFVHDWCDGLLAFAVAQCSNQAQKGLRATSSVSPATALRRKRGLESSTGSAQSVMPGLSASVSRAACRMSCSARPPVLAIEIVEDGQHLIGDQLSRTAAARKNIEAHRPLLVGRVEHHDVVTGALRAPGAAPLQRGRPWGQSR